MSRRRLRPEERDLWNQVAQTTQPLATTRRMILAPKTARTDPVPQKKPTEPQPLQPFRLGERAKSNNGQNGVASPMSTSLSHVPLAMDKKAFTKLKRGKLQPEGRIDLHGMTLDQAHPALTRFVLRSHSEGKRLVLVITGKGKPTADHGPIPRRTGVLKHQVPHWLKMAPLASAVMQVSESHLRHGGGGAYYVYLRRQR